MENKMEIYIRLKKEAQVLVEKLQKDITSGKRRICENYGQKEIHKFICKKIDILQSGILSYQEECDIKSILYKVSNIR
jgi:hypothetical protein